MFRISNRCLCILRYLQVVNNEDNGSFGDEIPVFEEGNELLQDASDDKTSLSMIDQQGAASSTKVESEVCF